MKAGNSLTIIIHQKRMLARRTAKEIERINKYENKWKIKTSKNKFKLLAVSVTKPEDVIVEGQLVPYANEILTLGLKIKRTGINSHINNMIQRAHKELQKLKRFNQLTPRTKIHLYKALVRPLLEYPMIPICGISETNKIKLQRIQNKAIKFAASNDNEDLTLEDAHHKYKLEPYNIRLYKRGNKLWEKFCLAEPELTIRSIEENNNNHLKDHYWWPRIAGSVSANEPDPVYA